MSEASAPLGGAAGTGVAATEATVVPWGPATVEAGAAEPASSTPRTGGCVEADGTAWTPVELGLVPVGTPVELGLVPAGPVATPVQLGLVLAGTAVPVPP